MEIKPQISHDDMLNALIEAMQLHEVIGKRQPGWYDALQLAEAAGINRSMAIARMKAAEERGEVETAIVWDDDKNCRVRVWRRIESD